MVLPPRIECTGRRVPLSIPRRFFADFMHFASKMPLVAIMRRMQLQPVVDARRQSLPTPSWTMLFAKAFARISQERPELRRAYFSFPWPHLYECNESVALIAVERIFQGEPMVMFAVFKNPQDQSVLELMRDLDRFKNQPIDEVFELNRTIRITRLPRLVRRLLWRNALYRSGRLKAQNFGTFAISSVASAQATTVGMASLLTNTLSFGPLDDAGRMDVRLDFDHRVYDGLPAAQTLARLEEVLCTEIVDELKQLANETRIVTE